MVGRRPRVALRVLGRRRGPTDRARSPRIRPSPTTPRPSGRRRTTRWPSSPRRCPGTRSSLVPRRRGRGSEAVVSSLPEIRPAAESEFVGRDVRALRRARGRDRAVRRGLPAPEGSLRLAGRVFTPGSSAPPSSRRTRRGSLRRLELEPQLLRRDLHAGAVHPLGRDLRVVHDHLDREPVDQRLEPERELGRRPPSRRTRRRTGRRGSDRRAASASAGRAPRGPWPSRRRGAPAPTPRSTAPTRPGGRTRGGSPAPRGRSAGGAGPSPRGSCGSRARCAGRTGRSRT